MTKVKNSKLLIFCLAATLPVLSLTSGCSDEKAPESSTQTQAPSVSQPQSTTISVDSPQDPTPEAEEDQKQTFRENFAAKCAERELNNSQNQTSDADRINKACGCIADYIAKDLTDEEAKKYLFDHEDPQSLRIKYEAGAYECLQEKQKPAEPKISKPAQ